MRILITGADGQLGRDLLDALLAGQVLVDAYHKLGDIVQPRELRVVYNEPEQFSGRNFAVVFLVRAQFHFE